MPKTITLASLSPTMTEGTIAKWHKAEGDQVKAGEVLCEVTTDKSTVEQEAFDDGFLRKILVKEGGKAFVNQAIAVTTETADEDISSYEVEQPNAKEPKEEPEEEEDSSDDTSAEPARGEAKAALGASFMTFAPFPPNQEYRIPEQQPEEKLKASPLARKLAQEKGLDLASVKGSGPRGRILAKDIEFAAKKGIVSFTKEAPTKSPGSYQESDLSQMRRVIGERLQAAKATIPHYYIHDEIAAKPIIALRAQLKELGMKVTFNDFVIKATALALKRHPQVNAGFNSRDGKLIRFETIDISIAISIPEGLITPIIFHTDHKNLLQISREVRELAKKAKENRLKPTQYQGGSFTISNLGMYGITSFDPVINPPQAAILGVGGIKERPVIENGVVVPGHLMTLTLAADHRVIDGAEGADFLRTLKQILENPAALLL